MSIENSEREGLNSAEGKREEESPKLAEADVVAQKKIEPHKWFVLRDLTRHNALMPAYKVLTDIGFETFTPMVQHLSVKRGRHIAEYVPFIHDLLFVHSTREQLDPIIARTPTLQYRYVKGGKLNDPMVVPEDDMNRFMDAVRQSEKVIYIKPEEVDSNMYGKQVRIIGGVLDGHVGTLISRRGSKSRSLQLKLPGLLYARIDVTGMDYIEIKES